MARIFFYAQLHHLRHFSFLTELIAFMTYEAKFGATARMNLGLIAGSLVTFCFLLFGILRLVENDLFQM